MTSLAFAGSGRITVVHGLAAGALGLEVTQVASRDRAHALERADQLGAKVCAYDELPAGADVVVVATPPAHHAESARRALEAGATVLVEKPLCTTLIDADELVALADAHDQRLLYAENLAFAPVIQHAVALAHGLGPLTHLETRAMQGPPDWGDFLTPGWGGGALFDLGVHPLAVALLIAGTAEPVEVRASLDRADGLEVDDLAEVELRFDTGLTARIGASWRATEPAWDAQAASDTGVVRVDLLPSLSLEHDGEPVSLPPVRAGLEFPQLEQFGYLAQLEAAVALADGRGPNPLDARFARRVLDIVCAAYWSAGRAGAAVPLPFAGPRDRTPLQLWRD